MSIRENNPFADREVAISCSSRTTRDILRELLEDESSLVEFRWKRDNDAPDGGFKLQFAGADGDNRGGDRTDETLHMTVQARMWEGGDSEAEAAESTINLRNFRWRYPTDRDEARLKFDVGSMTFTAGVVENVSDVRAEETTLEVEPAVDSLAANQSFQIRKGPDYEDFVGMFFDEEEWSDERQDDSPIDNDAVEIGQAPIDSTLHPDLQRIKPRYQSGRTWNLALGQTNFVLDSESGVVSTDFGDDIEDMSFLEFSLRVALLHVAIRIPILLYGRRKIVDDVENQELSVDGFPDSDDFRLARPVALDPKNVREQLKEDGYFYPSHVIEAACTSLNAGKHVIFTGPPGCGKSKLAVELGRLAGEDDENPLVATASPAWTTNEVVGRYLPRRDGEGLRFDTGFFLRAASDQRWFIIDELNRADIDAAFGELFSVLAGDVAEVPYREGDEEREDGASEKRPETESTEGRTPKIDWDGPGKRVRIIPFGADAVSSDEYRDYHVPQDFRLLATMNDADRSRLHQLSFALQRRFNVVRVEAPTPAQIKELMKEKISSLAVSYGIYEYDDGLGKLCSDGDEDQSEYCFEFVKESSGRHVSYPLNDSGGGSAFRTMENLFADGLEGADGDFKDLVAERIVGVATILDVIRFVAEALRAPESDVTEADQKHPTAVHFDERADGMPGGQTDAGRAFARSKVALALSLNVIPQLEKLTGRPDKLFDAIEFIFEVFEEDYLYRIKSTSDDSPDELVVDGRINDFLAKEIALQLGQGSVQNYESKWRALAGTDVEGDGLITEIPDVY